MSKAITWDYDGDFCSARFVNTGRKQRRCTGCDVRIEVSEPSWRVFSPGSSHSVCIECWDHLENCDACRQSQSDWESVAECRRESAMNEGTRHDSI